jgi:hypothetical protein
MAAGNRVTLQSTVTWRLDTTTGEDCILLTSEADWKKPETAAQGCVSH